MIDSGGPLILLAEDEAKMAQVIADYLGSNGFRSEWVADGNAVIEAVNSMAPALLLLDVMLPGRDGMSICREIRASSELPIIMVTARVEEIDRLLGLELGADDYVCKPFSPRELVARIKTVLRRTTLANASTVDESALQIDTARYEARLDGEVLPLTPVEFNLLRVIAAQPGRVYSRAQLLDALYDDFRDVSDRTIDSHVKNLRRKIEVVRAHQNIIISVYGVGYKFEPPAPA